MATAPAPAPAAQKPAAQKPPGKSVQRRGDISSGGGIIVGPCHSDIRINNRPAAKRFDLVTPHKGCSLQTWWHCICFTTGVPGSKTVRANGQPLILAGDFDTCITHSRKLGSSDVKAV